MASKVANRKKRVRFWHEKAGATVTQTSGRQMAKTVARTSEQSSEYFEGLFLQKWLYLARSKTSLSKYKTGKQRNEEGVQIS